LLGISIYQLCLSNETPFLLLCFIILSNFKVIFDYFKNIFMLDFWKTLIIVFPIAFPLSSWNDYLFMSQSCITKHHHLLTTCWVVGRGSSEVSWLETSAEGIFTHVHLRCFLWSLHSNSTFLQRMLYLFITAMTYIRERQGTRDYWVMVVGDKVTGPLCQCFSKLSVHMIYLWDLVSKKILS
jgi:hypothetical protein